MTYTGQPLGKGYVWTCVNEKCQLPAAFRVRGRKMLDLCVDHVGEAIRSGDVVTRPQPFPAYAKFLKVEQLAKTANDEAASLW